MITGTFHLNIKSAGQDSHIGLPERIGLPCKPSPALTEP